MISDERLKKIASFDPSVSMSEAQLMAKELERYRKAFSEPAAYTVDGQLRFENELKIGDMWAEPFDKSVDVPLYRKPEV